MCQSEGGILFKIKKSSGETNYEVVEIYFDENVISYEGLLDFLENHNPTTLNRQGLDIGTQYRSVIFYTTDVQRNLALDSIELIKEKWSNPIVTKIEKAPVFFRAEEYHQNYLNKNNLGNCSL